LNKIQIIFIYFQNINLASILINSIILSLFQIRVIAIRLEEVGD
jgi:hypothetical protein